MDIGVMKHTLFHYDQIGLFQNCAEGRGERYRYYFVWQMDVFEVIKALQKLGMFPGRNQDHYLSNRRRTFMKIIWMKRAAIDRDG